MLNRSIIAVLVILLCFKDLHAQSFHFPVREEGMMKTGHQIATHNGGSPALPDTLIAWGYLWFLQQGTSSSNWPKVISQQTQVKFYINHTINRKVNNVYAYKLAYKLFGYTNPLDSSQYTVIYDTITVAYNPDTLTAYQDMQIKQYPGFYKSMVVLTGIYKITSGSAPVAFSNSLNGLDTNFNVELTISTKKFTRSNYLPADMQLEADHSTAYLNNNLLEVRWNLPGYSTSASCPVEPANFELEWTYVDDYNGLPSTWKYDFRHNSTRVIVRENRYKIPLIYQKGYLLYRIRMVRPDSVLFQTPIYGPWTNGDQGLVSTMPDKYQITTPHMGDSTNWQYTISFAEEGKFKHVQSYYDGLLMNRQSVTRFNSQPNKLIVTENIYDHEANVAIKTLPAPVSSQSFRYQPYVALHNGAGNAYRAAYFDTVLTNLCPAEVKIDKLSPASLASVYYSPLNPDQSGFQKFVPDAEGYPFTHTIYAPGYDKRIERQGGAGDSLQIGNGHDTRFIHVSADQIDLNRLLGLDAGKESYYHKIVTKDPNGQYSVGITDYKGRQVMTGLTGEINTVRHALVLNDEVPNDTMYYSDLLAGSTQLVTPTSRILDKSIFIEAPALDSIIYKYRIVPFPICDTPSLGLSVAAHYKYSFIDECGQLMATDSGVLGVTGVIPNPTPITGIAWDTVFLDKGKYSVHKELFINEADVDLAIDSFFRHSPTCLKTEDEFIREEVEATPFPCPKPKDPCSELKMKMMDELFPNKKYGQYIDNNGEVFWNDTTQNSIFDRIYPSHDQPDWLYRYQDPCLVPGLDTVVITKYGVTYTRLDTIDVHTFISLFSGTAGYQIAEALLPLHPEYCKLLSCFNDTFGVRFEAIPDARIADSLNLLLLDSILAVDPLIDRLALLDPSANWVDSLRMIPTFGAIDSFVLQHAYCDCSDPHLILQCLAWYGDSISQRILPPGVPSRNFYFKKLQELYIYNREKYKSYIYGENEHCAPCDSQRMKLIQPPLIPVYYTAGGGINLSSSSILGQFSPTVQNAILAMTAGGSADPADFSTFLDSATAFIQSADSALCMIAIDSIVSKMANCPQFWQKRTAFANALLLQVIMGKVHYGHFYPEHINLALNSAGITQGDLCNPYIISYNYFDPPSPATAGCKQPDYYTHAKNWFNDSAIRLLLGNASSANLNLNSMGNLFEQDIFSALGITGSTATVHVAANYHGGGLYQLALSHSGDTVNLFIKASGVSTTSTTGNIFDTTGGGGAEFTNMVCIRDMGTFMSEGYIGNFVLGGYIARVKDTVEEYFTCLGWNDLAFHVTSPQSNILGAYIPFTEIKRLYPQMLSTFAGYQVKGTDHPLFGLMQRNYLNLKLKRIFSEFEYEDFIESAALADSIKIPRYLSYANVNGNSSFNYNTFSTLLADNGLLLKTILRYKATPTSPENLLLDLTQVPHNKLRVFDSLVTSQTGGTVNVPLNTGSPSTVGWLLLPGNLSSVPSAIAGLFNFSSPETLQVYQGSFQIYTRFVAADPGLTPAQLSRNIGAVHQYLSDQAGAGYWLTFYQHTVNRDYYKIQKQELLSYSYSLQSMQVGRVLDSLEADNLKLRLPSLSGQSVSYQLPGTPGDLDHLYYSSGSFHYPGYDTMLSIIDKVTAHLGGKLFPAIGVNTVTVPLPAPRSLKVYRCGDGTYWYRYFNGADKLYNIFLEVPKFVYESEHPGLVKSGDPLLAMGDTNNRRFTLAVIYGGALQPYTVQCRTDFDISWSGRLRNVLLGDDPLPPSVLQELEQNCEQQLLTTAIYTGKANYQQYIENFKKDLRPKFLAYLQDSTREWFYLGYNDRRFNITLYRYDRAGNLISTTPPMGVHKLSPAAAAIVDSVRNTGGTASGLLPAHTKESRYTYNSLNQLVKQQTPDGGEVRYWYDRLGRVVFSQNDVQKPGWFAYTLYDDQNRVRETGVAWIYGVLDTTGNQILDVDVHLGMIMNSYRKDVVCTIYDRPFKDLGQIPGHSAQENLRKRISCIKYFESFVGWGKPDTAHSYSHATHYSYDAAGNVKTLVQEFPQMWNLQQQYKRIDYEYDLWSGKVNLLSYNRGFADQFYQRYSYDADNRLVKAESSHDGLIWKQEASYEYYQHGPLARMQLGDLRVQSLDYAYTIQGWLKAINGDTLDYSHDMGGDGSYNFSVPDAYATVLNYFKGDYKPIGSTPVSVIGGPSRDLFNGNIAQISNAILPFRQLVTDYTYDQLNRIKNAAYNTITFPLGDHIPLTLTPVNDYASNYRYDMDGNITRLVRRNATGALTDSLNYFYYTGYTNNKLINVTDHAPNTGSNDLPQMTNLSAAPLSYDAIGQLKKDGINHIDTIKWNHLGKLKETKDTFHRTNLAFTYDGMGNRVMKVASIVKDTNALKEWEYYIRDAQGNILAIYRKATFFADSTVNMIKDIQDQGVNGMPLNQFIHAVLMPHYAHQESFMQAVLNMAEDHSYQYPVSFYLKSEPGIMLSIIRGTRECLDSLQEFETNTNANGIGQAVHRSSNEQGGLWDILAGCFSVEDEDRLQLIGHMPAELAGNVDELLGIADVISELTEDEKRQARAGELSRAEVANEVFTYCNELWPDLVASFISGLVHDPNWLQKTHYLELGTADYTRDALLYYGTPDSFYSFFDAWSPAWDHVRSYLNLEEREAIVYHSDPARFLEAFIADKGLEAIAYALDAIPSFDALVFAKQVVSVASTDPGPPITFPKPITYTWLSSQRHYLSEHHLYGSSRLGIVKYLPQQLGYVWDYENLTPSGEPTFDSSAFAHRHPWYSSALEGLIQRDSTRPWGGLLDTIATGQFLLGIRQYELTNHLGNVMATVSDKRQHVDMYQTGYIHYSRPALRAAYDYYPFGSLMSGRYLQFGGENCMTVTRAYWVPKWIYSEGPQWHPEDNGGNVNITDQGISIDAEEPYDGGFMKIPSEPNAEHQLVINFTGLTGNFRIRVTERQEAGVDYLLTSKEITTKGEYTLLFTPQTDTVKVSLTLISETPGVAIIWPVTWGKKVFELHNALANLCDDLDDPYRFGFNGHEKVNEIAGVGNHYTALFWEMDPRTARRWNTDPKPNLSISPYAILANNPIYHIDVLGDTTYRFNQADGKYIGMYDTDVRGQQGSYGTMKTLGKEKNKQEMWDGQYFQFADPVNDPKDIANGTINKLIFVSDADMKGILTSQGAFNYDDKDELTTFYGNSTGGKPFDYSYSVIPKVFGAQGASSDPLNSPSSVLFLPQGDYTAHNHMNFGNYLWAASGYTLGFETSTLKLGGHANSIMNPGSNGYKRQWDSKDDQRSIELGSFHALQWKYRAILEVRHQLEVKKSGGSGGKR